jgi:hypothetical protein
MILTALILAQLLSSTASAPVDKAGYGPPRTLSDLARERKLRKPTGTGTFSVTGAEGMPVLLAPVYGEGGSFEEVSRSDAAHRPAPYAPLAVYDPYLPNFFPNGYSTRTYYPRPHSHPQAARPAAPSRSAPSHAPARRSPSHTTSGLTKR